MMKPYDMTIQEVIKSIRFPFDGQYHNFKKRNISIETYHSWEDIFADFEVNPKEVITDFYPTMGLQTYDKTLLIGTPLDMMTFKEEIDQNIDSITVTRWITVNAQKAIYYADVKKYGNLHIGYICRDEEHDGK